MCSYTPRFSYSDLKTRVSTALLAACSTAYTGGYGPGGYQGGYTGWVPGWAIPGTTQPARCSRGSTRYSEAGPGSPWQGLEWVVSRTGRARAPGTTTPGPCRTLRARFAVPGPLPENAASWPIRARFSDILLKVSQNGKVSPKKVSKAYHSPYFQNGPQKSPLGIPRISFSLAFSHKELMGLFGP